LTEKHRLKAPFVGVVPAISFLLAFFVIPFIALLYLSLKAVEDGTTVSGLSLLAYTKLLRDPFTYYLFGRTISLSVLVTILCVILGYPVAYIHSKIKHPAAKAIILMIVTAPLLTSSLVLSFGWIIILGKYGLVNRILLALNLIDEPLKILFTMTAVIVGMTQVQLPYMIVPLISTLQKLPQDLEDASADLGATKWQTFWKVTIPQSVPAIASGMSLVFILSYTMFVVPTLMGGTAIKIVSVYIWNNVRLLTWDMAAAISSLLLITSLSIITLFNIVIRRLTPWQYTRN
jgi:ABC-type spermidine/putrescine transport system permease subunit I